MDGVTWIYAQVAYAGFSFIHHWSTDIYETLITDILEADIWCYPLLCSSIPCNFHFSQLFFKVSTAPNISITIPIHMLFLFLFLWAWPTHCLLWDLPPSVCSPFPSRVRAFRRSTLPPPIYSLTLLPTPQTTSTFSCKVTALKQLTMAPISPGLQPLGPLLFNLLPGLPSFTALPVSSAYLSFSPHSSCITLSNLTAVTSTCMLITPKSAFLS